MMTFMKSKLTKMTGKDKKNYIFQKGKPYEISRTDICAYIHTIYIYIYIYIYIWGPVFIIQVFYWCIPLESILNAKKTSNLIKNISSHNISSEIKSQQVKKPICQSVIKHFDFSQNCSVPIHRVTFVIHFRVCF